MPETIAATQIEQDWEEIIDSIDAEKCVIFLGSGIYQMPEEQNIDQALGRWLDLDNPDHPSIQLHNDDGFFLFRSERRHKRKVIEQIKSFYNQPFPETSACFTQLAQIPFHIIMSVMPDNILSRTFDDLGFPYQADLYFRKRPHPQNFEQPSRNKPLIYNLLGNIEEPESLVLTHSDFFDYMESVFIAKSMHPTLKEELELAERYIFLGLPYEKWYFQFLLRVLSLHSDKLRDVERMAVKEFQNPKLQKLYTEEFKINFITTHPELFIKDLHQACADAGVLKKLPTPDPQLANLPDLSPYELKELLAKAEMESAFQHLKIFLERRKPRSHSLANDLVVLRNQYNLLNKREIMGTIDSRDLNVEQNQMIERLTNLIDQAGELG